jgi:hypothetical protein
MSKEKKRIIGYTLIGVIGGAVFGNYIAGYIGMVVFAFLFSIFGAAIDGIRESVCDIYGK